MLAFVATLDTPTAVLLAKGELFLLNCLAFGIRGGGIDPNIHSIDTNTGFGINTINIQHLKNTSEIRLTCCFYLSSVCSPLNYIT